MDEHQLQSIILRLGKCMRETQDEELYGQMTDVRADLRAWNREGDLPNKELLRTWDVIALESVPTTAEPQPAAALTEANVQQILKTLRGRIVDAGDRDDAAEEVNLQAVRQAVLAWHKSGMSGDLPYMEQLSARGIWPPAPEEALPSPTQAPLAEIPAQPAQPQEVVSSAPDPDDKLQEDYDLARSLMDQYQHLKARGKLLDLQGKSSGRLKEPIGNDLRTASQKLEEQTNERIRVASGLSGESLDKQAEAWQAVVQINPQSEEARQALKAVEQRRVERNIETDFEAASQRADTAKGKLDLPELNRLLGQTEVWLSMGEKGELPQHLYIKAKTLKDDVIATRQVVRDKLGVVSTMRMQGDLRGSYHFVRDSFESGIPTLVDTGGAIGPAGAEVPTARFFAFIASEFLSSIQTKVSERVDKAMQEEKSDPEAAQASLLEARGWVTDEVLTLDHRRQLGTQLAMVDQELKNVARSLESHRQARQKVIEARTQADSAQERLKLLLEAQELFPSYLNLDQYLEQARDDLAAEVSGQVAAAITTAQQHAKRDRYAEALQELQSARTLALKVVPQPKVNSLLAAELLRLAQVEQIITNDEQSYHHLVDILAQVDKAIEFHRSGDPTALRQARNLLEQLTDVQRKHPKSSEVHSRLAALQDDRQNYEDGMSAYRQQDWRTAESYLDKVASGNSPEEADAKKLTARATAAQRAAQAAAAEQAARPDWKAAISHYKTALALFQQFGTDPFTESIYEACLDAVKRLTPIERSESLARKILDDVHKRLPQLQDRSTQRKELVDKLQPIEFDQLVLELQEAARIPSTLVEEVNDWLRKVQEVWRETYLGNLDEALNAYTEAAKRGEGETFLDMLYLAQKRISELDKFNLLYQPQDKRLYRQIQSCYLDVEYARLKVALEPDWVKIEANRRQQLELSGAEQTEKLGRQLDEAIQNQIEEQINRFASEGKFQEAKQYLLEKLKSPIVHSNPRIVQLLIETCWETKDWSSARAAAQGFIQSVHGKDGASLVAIWSGLTSAAERFDLGEFEHGQAEITQLRKNYGSNADYDHIISNKEKQLLKVAIEVLVHQARRAEQKGIDEGYSEAMAKYALACKLDPDDSVVRAGLDHVSVVVSIQALLRAARLALAEGETDDALNKVQKALGIMPAYSEALQLKDRIERTIQAHVKTEQAEAAYNEGRYNEAMELVDAILKEIQPNFAEAVTLGQRIRRSWDEQKLQVLLEQARAAWLDDHVDEARDVLADARPVVECFPTDYRSIGESKIKSLEESINESEQIRKMYQHARDVWKEGRETRRVEKLTEAMDKFYQIVLANTQNEVVCVIQRNAKELVKGILAEITQSTQEEGLLDLALARLAYMLHAEPRDASLLLAYNRVQATKYRRDQTQREKSVHVQMDEEQAKRHDNLAAYSRRVGKEAFVWYVASLFSAIVAFVVFIYAIVLLIQTREALSYLTPLYTLVPGTLSALFFNQYAQANQRVDGERERVWRQSEEYEKRKLNEIESIRNEVQRQIQSLEAMSSATIQSAAITAGNRDEADGNQVMSETGK
jgi:hypothetical protein